MGAGLPFKRGFYQVDRNVLTSDVFGNQSRMAVWTYLTSQAGYSNGHWRDRNEVILLKAGDLVLSIRQASKLCGMARETFVKTLRYFEQKGLINFRALKTGTVISLAKRAFDAVFRPRGRAQAHKEIKVLSRSYNSLPSYVVPSSSAGVMDAQTTKNYLTELYDGPTDRSLSSEILAGIRRIQGRL